LAGEDRTALPPPYNGFVVSLSKSSGRMHESHQGTQQL